MCISKLTFDWPTKAEFIDIQNKNTGIKLIFPPGEKCFMSTFEYKLTYLIYCDMSEEIRFKTIRKVSTCIYEYHFLSKHACYVNFNKDSAFSSKKILFYLIGIFSFYCIGFSFMNYKNNPDDGIIKALPHRDFWREFLENVRIGASIFKENSLRISRNVSRKIKDKYDFYKGNNNSEGY